MAFSPRLESLITRALLAGAPGVSSARLSLLIDDDHGAPTDRLIDLCFEAARFAHVENLSDVSGRITDGPRWPDVWPGEHYRFLAGLVKALRPASVVEIGTHQGLSALALAKNLPPAGRLHSYDIVPWDRIPGQTLRAGDLRGGRIVPVTADLTRQAVFDRYREILETADLIFVDAAKDGRMEKILLERLETLFFRTPPIVVFDDIRLWNMLGIWRSVSRPKLDATSFGHWSGTGMIDWQRR
jgi:predicted O-methyltransferase YrrM